jgi:hypothetical protein
VFIAASAFVVVGLAYAAWCVVATIDAGFQGGAVGMALLSAALCYQGLALFQDRRHARVAGIVSASALAIGNLAVALLLALPWLSAAGETTIPRVLLPTLALLLATATAFAVAVALLIADLRARPNFRMERTRHG